MNNVLTNLPREQADRHGDRIALTFRDKYGNLTPYTWSAFADAVDHAAAALAALDIEPGDRIALFSANRVDMLVTDFGAYANRAVPVSIYATSTREQVEYIINDSGSKILFAGNDRQLALALEAAHACPSLKLIVSYTEPVPEKQTAIPVMTMTDFIELGKGAGPEAMKTVEQRRADALPEDIATLIYTSGTTGEPKGAILNHSCFTACLHEHKRRLTMLTDDDTSLSFLPLSHIFEKAWTYFCMFMAMRVTVNLDPKTIQDAVKQVQPTCMCSVPRFWEKAYTAVQEQLHDMPALARWLANRAVKIGRRRNIDYARLGLPVPKMLERRYRFYDKRIFSVLKRAIGIPKGNLFPTAGAPLSPKIVEFFQSCGIDICIGYGLSETTATVTCYPIVGWELGTVGTPLDCVQIKIGDNNEILVKGPTVMSGYYNKPLANAEAFTADGWFRTGDAGSIDASGALTLTERLKDLFKTSNGKYIAPQALESRLGEDKFIEQIAVIGDQRKYVTALIVPSFPALKDYADKKKIPYASVEDLVKNPDIIRMLTDRIDRLQHGFAGFEKIKKFTLLPQPFTMDSGELTNTLKIRRPVINERYAKEIDAMYE